MVHEAELEVVRPACADGAVLVHVARVREGRVPPCEWVSLRAQRSTAWRTVKHLSVEVRALAAVTEGERAAEDAKADRLAAHRLGQHAPYTVTRA